jgi:NitT/TauT family transport system ATP-binding protein
MQGAEAQAASPAASLAGIDITFNLKDGGRYQVVSQINLDVAPGEFVAVVGPTGCGKSTLLNAAAGLLQPSAGKVGILGEPLRGLNLKVGHLFQLDALMPWKTALQNVAVALESQGVAGKEADERARAWLARAGLRAFTDRYPHRIAESGMKSMLDVLKTLDPELANATVDLNKTFTPQFAQRAGA